MTITVRSLENFQVEISNGHHQWHSDEPLDAGGDNMGPGPFELLLSSLGACKVITAHMYARRKGWPLAGVEVKLSTHRIAARDCEDCTSEPNAKVDIIEADISFAGDLSTEQRNRLQQIADRCPVHRTLTSETKIRTTLVEAKVASSE